MSVFNDLLPVLQSIAPGWQHVEYYRETTDPCVVLRSVQGGRSDKNTRRFVYQVTVMSGQNTSPDEAETVANNLARHFLDNHRRAGVLLATVMRDVTGPFYSDKDRAYYTFDLSIINSAN